MKTKPSGRSSTAALAALLAVFVTSPLAPESKAGIGRTGRWTAVADWAKGNDQRYAIHLILLRGDGNPYHSRVIWFRGEAPGQFLGGQWGWRATEDTCLAWPTASFDSLQMVPSGVNFFCGGHATLADTRLMLSSGTSPSAGTYGENRTRIFTPGTGSNWGSWTESDSLVKWRWYSTVTTLADGRILTTAGAQHRFHRLFGGRRRDSGMPTDAEGDKLYRFTGIVGGDWYDPVTPANDNSPPNTGNPDIREHHTLIEMTQVDNFGSQVLFGGRDNSGDALDDAWELERHNNPLGSDYFYAWDKFFPLGTLPARRSDHSAIAALKQQMVVFGGRGQDGQPRNDTHRLFWSSGEANHRWQAMQLSGGPPSARLGHQASYHETYTWSGATEKAMYVFGGTAHPDSAPTDARVWRLVFSPTNPNEGTWDSVATTDLNGNPFRPLPRWGHAMAADTALRKHPTLDSLGRVTFFHGGELSTGVYSDTLLALWHFRDGTTRWEVISAGAQTVPPGARAHHAMTLDGNQGDAPAQQPGGRLYLFGGKKSNTELADKNVYVLDPWAPSGRTWQAWDALDSASIGHTFTLELGGASARVAEIYDPAANDWVAHTNAVLLDRNYPITFTVGRAGSDSMRVLGIPIVTRPHYLDIPNTGYADHWNSSSARQLGFAPLNAVLYRPDSMLVGGGKGIGDTPVDSTFVFNVSSPATSPWVLAGLRQLSRYHHNLVILPSGNVLAVGGVGTADESATTNPRYQPELWSDSTRAWTTSLAGEQFALQTQIRDYHSTAILLPDGRVLSAGGQNRKPDRGTAEIYCPPYLFKATSDVAAERPAISSKPLQVTWGQPFTICSPDVDSVTRAVLIRPGATTHSFDQNQRYVPLLRVTKGASPSRLLVTTPSNPGHAPPGDYMLFLTGSADGGDVPSIARWIRVSSTVGHDSCDVVAPGKLTSLWPELITTSSMYLTWGNTADDDSMGASGKIQSLDLRKSTQAISNEAAWTNADQIADEPAPDTAGVEHNKTVGGLQACTDYYFALRGRDDVSNLSSLHQQVKAKTLCSGGGGGGDPGGAGRDVTTTSSDRRETSVVPQQAATAAAALVVESERVVEGGWRLILRSMSEFEGVDANRVLIQAKDPGGAWETKNSLTPWEADALLGICAPRAAGRRVFAGSYELKEIARSLRSASGPLALASAEHSSGGSITTAVQGGNGAVTLTPGQTLELVYEPSELATTPTHDWFALLQRNDQASPTRAGVAEALDLPKQFALYQNQPNPFQGTTTIRFDLPKPVPVRLTIYDIAGRRVRSLIKEDWPAGRHAVEWDHRSDAGVQLGAGAYIYRIQAGDFRADRKMIVLP